MASDNSIEIKEDSAGKVVNVKFSGGKPIKSDTSSAYLFDLRKFDLPLKRLEFEWSSTENNRVIPVRIEASDGWLSGSSEERYDEQPSASRGISIRHCGVFSGRFCQSPSSRSEYVFSRSGCIEKKMKIARG